MQSAQALGRSAMKSVRVELRFARDVAPALENSSSACVLVAQSSWAATRAETNIDSRNGETINLPQAHV